MSRPPSIVGCVILDVSSAPESRSVRLLGFDQSGTLLVVSEASPHLQKEFGILSVWVRVTQSGKQYEIASPNARKTSSGAGYLAGFDVIKDSTRISPQFERWGDVAFWNYRFSSPLVPTTAYRTIICKDDTERQFCIERSRKSGKDWEKLNVQVKGISGGTHLAVIRYFHPTEPMTFFLICEFEGINDRRTEDYFVMTDDDGVNFRVLGKGDQFSYLEIARTSPNVWYRITDHRLLYRSDNAEKGPWFPLQSEVMTQAVYRSDGQFRDFRASQIAVSAFDAGLLLVCSSNGLLRSEDYGKSWSVVNLETKLAQPVAQVAFDPANPDIAYAGGETGFYLSKDKGKSWSKIDIETQIGNKSFRKLKFSER